MSPVAELVEIARAHRFIARCVAAFYASILLVHVWDREWLWALFAAIVIATCVSTSRSVTRTLERIR